MRSMRLTINGNELFVVSRGSGPAVLTLHGAPGLGDHRTDQKAWAPLAGEMRIVSYDQRGSGQSEGRPPFSHEQFAADAEALRQKLGLGDIVLAGGSYGGFIALEYALRYPRHLRALVLRDTAASHHHHDVAKRNALASGLPGIDAETLDRLFSGRCRDDDDFRTAYQALQPLYNARYDPVEGARRLKLIRFRHETHNWAFSRNLPRYDLRDRLSQIRAPTLVVCGRHDWITPVACSEEIAAGIPGARLVIFEHSGHAPHLEENERFIAEVRAFLASVG